MRGVLLLLPPPLYRYRVYMGVLMLPIPYGGTWGGGVSPLTPILLGG